MTREEHIKAAEELLTGSWLPHCGYQEDPTDREIAAAHVHATLALAMTPSSESAPVRVSRWRRKAAR